MSYAIRLFITSGSGFLVPTNFDPLSNLIECYGSGNQPTTFFGGAGGAYASGVNIPAQPGHIINIGVGTPSGTTDTFFNASSLSNAVSQGSTLAVAAQGATSSGGFHPTVGGLASASVGNTLTYSGGGGGSNGNPGGGGGAAAGPNGDGGYGADATSGKAGVGGGGGGCNGGTDGGQTIPDPPFGPLFFSNYGGNNRLGAGGSQSSSSPGTSGGGGCGGNEGSNGSAGSLDDVYGDGIHGPGSGGGGGGYGGNGGNAGGYGGGGTIGFTVNGAATGGLIVVNYNILYGVDSVLIG